ncbi:hypothetical protein [Streptomyces sp. NPDC058614]|uniref:hypothetical protein n=1 Tax=Streptomyces sp. NPDC058614 TaxID=3346557 RepID=UPI003665A571
MIVRLVGGPLGGRELSTTPGPWAGDWLTAGDVDWGLYVPVHRDSVTGVVVAEIRATTPRRRETSECASLWNSLPPDRV